MLFSNLSTPAFSLKYLTSLCISPPVSPVGREGGKMQKEASEVKSMIEYMLECSYFYGKSFNCLDI